MNCEMYSIQYDSKSIKMAMDTVKKQIDDLAVDILSLEKVKGIVAKEKQDKDDPEVVEYKKKLMQVDDLSKGLKYLKKALIHCKRSGH